MRGRARFGPILAIGALACAGAGPPVPPSVAGAELTGNFLWRQHVLWSVGPANGSAHAVIQRRCDELVVLLLDALGVPGVEIHRRGGETKLVSRSRALPFEPEWILRDVERAYLRLPAPRGAEGAEVVSRAGELEVRERFVGERLEQRSYHRLADGEAVWVARYGGSGTPDRVEIEDLELGYRLQITTVARSQLDCPVEPAPSSP